MHVQVIGLGYIGLPTALTIASARHSVVGYDVNEEVLNEIISGKLRIKEKGLNNLLKKVLKSGNFQCVDEMCEADAHIICVPTSMNKNKEIDLKHLTHAVDSAGKVLRRGNLVIIESTVPPGTTIRMYDRLKEKCHSFHMAFCPERLLPGNVLHELVHNDRLIGGVDRKSSDVSAKFYRTFVKGKIHKTDATTAEFVKLIENTYRAVNIAFANEISMLAEKYNISIYKAINLANNHPRVNIHHPGPGVGGYCLTKDPWFLIGKREGLIKEAMKINESMPYHVVQKIQKIVDGDLRGKKIAVLGAAYKGDVADTRESPGLKIANILRKKGAYIRIHDPLAKGYERELEDLLNWSEIIIITTDHTHYRRNRTKFTSMKDKILIDTKNVLGLG